ncbi:MAG TPA: universal stress protein [Polyangiaceae bacterium]|jgi:nucleotide-binding universal stress UspA family protein|nr:universal stress protein [Polyangiaceae bacterium]
MKPFQKLLVPVDFSAHSAEAVHVATDLARRYDASLTLIHVYDPLVYALPDGFTLFTQPQLERVFEALESQLAGAKAQAIEAGAARVQTRLLQGTIAGQITEYSARGEFDLVVMGTHGRTGMKHLVLGSIAEKVVRTAACPVLTVKKSTTPH